MSLLIYPDYAQLCRAVADKIVDYVNQKPASLICLASGHTPIGVFRCLAEDVKHKRVNFSACTFIGLDEWIGVTATHPGSCRAMMDRDFFLPLEIAKDKIHFFNGVSDDPDREVTAANTLIEEHGGMDIMLVGVGTNGHIAMNEPGTAFNSVAHISKLSDETIRTAAKYFDEPVELGSGITLGLLHFQHAKLPILMANGQSKSTAIAHALHSPPSIQLPASVIQFMPHVLVMVDREAAAKNEN